MFVFYSTDQVKLLLNELGQCHGRHPIKFIQLLDHSHNFRHNRIVDIHISITVTMLRLSTYHQNHYHDAVAMRMYSWSFRKISLQMLALKSTKCKNSSGRKTSNCDSLFDEIDQ